MMIDCSTTYILTSIPNFFQSSTFGYLTRLHRNTTATCKSDLAIFAMQRNLATIQWNRSVIVMSCFRHVSFTWNRPLTAGVRSLSSNSSGASARMFSRLLYSVKIPLSFTNQSIVIPKYSCFLPYDAARRPPTLQKMLFRWLMILSSSSCYR